MFNVQRAPESALALTAMAARCRLGGCGDDGAATGRRRGRRRTRRT